MTRKQSEVPGNGSAGEAAEYQKLRIAFLGGPMLCRACLRGLVRETLAEAEVIEAADIETILDLAAKGRKSDVVLRTALALDDSEVLAIRDLAQALSGIPLAVHTASEDAIALRSIVEFGVAGVIPTCVSTDVMGAALRLVAAGGTYLPANIFSRGAPASRGPVSREAGRFGLDRLTRRESQVFDLIAEGVPNKEVAKELGMAEATVKIHVHNILKKLKVRNRTQLAHMAARLRAQH